jgi:cation diffusion facilitator CzcD-associated flavoprotein CzcO
MIAADNSIDIAVIGAGISGINAGYRIQTGLPDHTYTIFEGRSEMGGTWSLFKYPGIRSDSDLFTFGFPWDPWTEDRAIASAPSILAYMKSTAAKHGIDQHIKYNSHVSSLNWQSDIQRWAITTNADSDKPSVYYARWILMGTGYYDYNEPLLTTIPNLSSFKGEIIHPQFWPSHFSYENKDIAVIGSGATAVTLIPAMAPTAKSVTMIQRSPGFFFAPPVVEQINVTIKKWFPATWAHQLIRWRMMVLGWVFFHICRMFPDFMKKQFLKGVGAAIPANLSVEKDFTPKYYPWQQRMCITPGGDFFDALKSGKADVATGEIETVLADGVKMKDGRVVKADAIVTATGLKINFGGHAAITVDGTPIHLNEKFVWKGALLQDVPNFAFVFGYTNASWTLGADATAQLFVRLVKTTEAKGMTSVAPKMDEDGKVKEVPLLNLNSTYINSAIARNILPKGGDKGPWVPRSSYFKDYWHAKWGDVTTGLRFERVSVE